MSTDYQHVVGIWDLDRPDAFMHMRALVKALPPELQPTSGTEAALRAAGRYLVIVSSVRMTPYTIADSAALDACLREAWLTDARPDGRIKAYCFGLADTTAIVEKIVANCIAAAVPIDLESEPLH